MPSPSPPGAFTASLSAPTAPSPPGAPTITASPQCPLDWLGGSPSPPGPEIGRGAGWGRGEISGGAGFFKKQKRKRGQPSPLPNIACCQTTRLEPTALRG